MFIQYYPLLISQFRPGGMPLPHFPVRRTEETVNRDPGDMRLSQRLKDPSAYLTIQRMRRKALEALLLAEPTLDNARKALDYICMIVEESTWAAAPETPFDDENHPLIDLQAAETAVLFGWANRLLGQRLNEISPLIINRMICEVRSRLFRPIQAHEDYPFMDGQGSCSLAIACDLLLAALLLEDEARVAKLFKPLLRLLDELCGRRGHALTPLMDTVTDISAIADLVSLLKRMTRGAMDLTDRVPGNDWLDEVLFMWIQDDYFHDPAGEHMTPALSGSDIFRIGLIAGDDALTALGAQIFRRNRIPSRTVTGRLMEFNAMPLLEAQKEKPPRLRNAALHNNLLMSARIPGLYCAIHIGGGRANAGDIALFADQMPILVDGGTDCPVRNLPSLAGYPQLTRPYRPCIADFEDREDREIMSVDLTCAYPGESELQSYQRTLLTLREEQTVRIMDAIVFRQPSRVIYSFVTATTPTPLNVGLRLGPVHMTWEHDFSVEIRPLSGSLSEIRLTAGEPIQRAFFTFNLERI